MIKQGDGTTPNQSHVPDDNVLFSVLLASPCGDSVSVVKNEQPQVLK